MYKLNKQYYRTVSLHPGQLSPIILGKGTTIWLYHNKIWYATAVADNTIEYDPDEIEIRSYINNRNYYLYTFAEPYPTHNGVKIDSIGWLP